MISYFISYNISNYEWTNNEKFFSVLFSKKIYQPILHNQIVIVNYFYHFSSVFRFNIYYEVTKLL